jgi:alkylation response protein AidB-like acyl-CoA dehydrogenase
MISGEIVCSFATTEPDASSDLSVDALQTVAEPTDGGLVVNGLKRWITSAVAAEFVVALCRTGRGMSMLLIPLGDPGVTVGEPDLKMGHRGQITSDVAFEDVFVPQEHVLGEVGKGLGVALSCLAHGRIGIGAAGVGVAQAALDLAVARLRTRKVFGKRLGEMQHWQFRLAERAIELEAARALYQKAALRLDREGTSEPEASMAKVLGTRLANDLARDALQVHGGLGFAREVRGTGERPRLEAIYRDAKILEIFEGANEVLTWVVARHLIGRDVTG